MLAVLQFIFASSTHFWGVVLLMWCFTWTVTDIVRAWRRRD